MKPALKSRLSKYGSAILICAAVVWMYLSGRVESVEAFRNLPVMEQYRLLCDAFFIPGTLSILSGCLIALGNAGALDALGYIGYWMLNTFLPNRTGKVDSYFDYVQEKKEKRVKGYGFLFLVGGVFLGICLVYLWLYYSV